jgi:hypothetical protein
MVDAEYITLCLHNLHLNEPIESWDGNICLGGALPLIFCIHMHSGPIYWGAIYLVEKIIRYGIFQNKDKCLYFIHPINNYKFLGKSFKNTLIYL